MSKSLHQQAFATDDVRGVIIGPVKIPGRLYYNGRRQSRTLWAEDETGLMAQARERKRWMIDNCGDFASKIYPDDSAWELRIYE